MPRGKRQAKRCSPAVEVYDLKSFLPISPIVKHLIWMPSEMYCSSILQQSGGDFWRGFLPDRQSVHLHRREIAQRRVHPAKVVVLHIVTPAACSADTCNGTGGGIFRGRVARCPHSTGPGSKCASRLPVRLSRHQSRQVRAWNASRKTRQPQPGIVAFNPN